MPGPLQHSPAPWHRESGEYEWLKDPDADIVDVNGDKVIEATEHWKNYHLGISNPADEVLILHAPDLYHTLKNLMYAVEVDSAKAIWSSTKEAANYLIQEIEQEAQTNG